MFEWLWTSVSFPLMRFLRRTDVALVLFPMEPGTASRKCHFYHGNHTGRGAHNSHMKKTLLVVNLGNLPFRFISNKGSQFWTLKCTLTFILHSLLAVTSHVKEKISFACFGMLSYFIEHMKWPDVAALHAHLSRGCVSIRKFVTETHGKKTWTSELVLPLVWPWCRSWRVSILSCTNVRIGIHYIAVQYYM